MEGARSQRASLGRAVSAFGVLAFVAVVLVGGVLRRSPEPRGRPARDATPEDAGSAARSSRAGPASADRDAAGPARRSLPSTEESSPPAEGPEAFARLLEALRRLESEPGFHAAALPLVEDLAEFATRGGREALSLLEHVAWNGRESPRVRGALFVSLGVAQSSARGDLVAFGARSDGDPESRRSAILGAACGDGRDGLPVRPAQFASLFDRPPLFPVLLRSAVGEEALRTALLQVAQIEEDRSVQETAFLALGPGVEKDPGVRSLYLEVLRSDAALLRRLQDAAIFVLAKSRHPEIVMALRVLLDDESVDYLIRARIASRLSDAGSGGETEALLRVLAEHGRSTPERIGAAVGLFKWLEARREGPEAFRVTATLVERALEDPDSSVRLTALKALEATADPAVAAYVCREALGDPSSPFVRQVAARGLARVPPGERRGAAATLLERYDVEADSATRARIVVSVKTLLGREALAFLQGEALRDPDSDVVEAARAAIAELVGSP